MASNDSPPPRQVRAVFDEATLIVYQAYSPQIADAALAAGTFVDPFMLDRMTWIKPSFLWMMYRSGWATKPRQERVLAVRITRTGFDEALTHACLSQYEPHVYPSRDHWKHRKQTSPVRVQWDPERSLHLTPLPWRTIQVGLSGTAMHSYVSEWIIEITDMTQTAHALRRLLDEGDVTTAQHSMPRERPYPLTRAAADATGAS